MSGSKMHLKSIARVTVLTIEEGRRIQNNEVTHVGEDEGGCLVEEKVAEKLRPVACLPFPHQSATRIPFIISSKSLSVANLELPLLDDRTLVDSSEGVSSCPTSFGYRRHPASSHAYQHLRYTKISFNCHEAEFKYKDDKAKYSSRSTFRSLSRSHR